MEDWAKEEAKSTTNGKMVGKEMKTEAVADSSWNLVEWKCSHRMDITTTIRTSKGSGVCIIKGVNTETDAT